MSENLIEYHFSNEKKPKSIKSVINKITKFHGDNSSEISSGRDGDEYYISFWVDNIDCNESIKQSLLYLTNFPSKTYPLAKLTVEQTGDQYFYVLYDKKLMSFDNEIDLLDHIESLREPSLEEKFYEQVDKTKANMLVRIKFSKKTQINMLNDIVNKFIKDRNEEDIFSIRKVLKKKPDANLHFEKLNKLYGKEQVDKIFTSVCFSGIRKNHIYLGYEFGNCIKIRPCSENEAYLNAERNIKNNEGLIILGILQFFCYLKDSVSVEAKFSSIESGFSGQFYSREEVLMEYSPYWKNPPPPARFW